MAFVFVLMLCACVWPITVTQAKRSRGAPKASKPGDKVMVSIVVTDVKDFSDLTRQYPELMNKAMGIHNNILRKASHNHAGYIMDQEVGCMGGRVLWCAVSYPHDFFCDSMLCLRPRVRWLSSVMFGWWQPSCMCLSAVCPSTDVELPVLSLLSVCRVTAGQWPFTMLRMLLPSVCRLASLAKIL